MTTSRAISADASSLIGAPSSPGTNEAQVIQWAFHAPRALPLPGTVSLGSLVDELETDPAMAHHMADARRALGPLIYGTEAHPSMCALRLSAGLSQQQLAQRVGTSQSHIARIERGNNDPTTDMVARIANALGVGEDVAFVGVRGQRLNRHAES